MNTSYAGYASRSMPERHKLRESKLFQHGSDKASREGGEVLDSDTWKASARCGKSAADTIRISQQCVGCML